MKISNDDIAKSLSSNKKTLVHFTAEWCGPCKKLAPVVDQLINEDPSIGYIKIDVDENPSVTSQFGIKSVPTLIAYNGSDESGRNIGAIPLVAIKKLFG